MRRLPLIYDTLLHIRIADNLSLTTLWAPIEAFGFYRPLTFLPLVLIQRIWGYYPAALLNGLNLGQHALNAALLGALAWRVWHSRARALAAGLLLAAFPFSYQAVAVYGHNVHPATAGLILLGLHGYVARIRGEWPRRWIGLGWSVVGGLFILSLLSHESAVLFGFFALLVQLNLPSSPPLRAWRAWFRVGRPAFVFIGLGMVYLMAYQFLPLTRAPESGEAIAAWPKLLYLGQAAAYPFVWWAHRLPALSATLLCLVAVSLTLGLSLRRGRSDARGLLWGWGWWAAASALIAVPLSADYLLHGPRLLYLGSLGLALAWSILLIPPAPLRLQAGHQPRRLLPGLLALFFILSSSSLFVRARLADYARLTSGVAVVADAMRGRPPAEGVLLLNLPAWIAPPRNTYAVGAELAAQLGYHLFAEEWVNDNLRAARPVAAIQVADLLAATPYPYGLHAQHHLLPLSADWTPAGSAVFVTRYTQAGPVMEWLGRFTPPTAVSPPALATFGPYFLHRVEAQACAGQVDLTLDWSLAEGVTPPGSASLFVQWWDDTGQLATQLDRPPLALRPDSLRTPSGWHLLDARRLTAAAVGGRLLIGAYDYATGQRFPAADAAGRPLADNAFALPIPPCPIAAP